MNEEAKNDGVTYEQAELGLPPGFCIPSELPGTRASARFAQKTIIITGGAGNFGQVCARRMASEGANVALWDMKPADAESNVTFLTQIKADYPDQTFAYDVVNITDVEQVQAATQKVITDFGGIDMLFNNAGIQGNFQPSDQYDIQNFTVVTNVNINGTFIVLQTVANAMRDAGKGGVIVNTASMAGHGVPPNMVAYATSKAAVIHMTKICAKDYAQHNIRINSVSPAFMGPGFMWKRQVELQAEAADAGSNYYSKDPVEVAKMMIGEPVMKRYGAIEEVMGPVTFLLSDDASYLTGIDIQITGGCI